MRVETEENKPLEVNNSKADEMSNSHLIFLLGLKYQLIDIGFEQKICEMVIKHLEPETLEEAIILMTQENNVWQHDFI